MNRSLLTNKEFARTDPVFRKACELAGIPPTDRQASRFRNGKGLAYKFQAAAIVAVQKKLAGVA